MFLFDVNTPYKLRRMDGQVYLDETEDSYCVWRTFFSEKPEDLHLSGGPVPAERPTGAWDRAFEEHRERAWEREELRARI